MIDLTVPYPKKRIRHSCSSLKTFATICELRYAKDRHLPWTDTPDTLRGSQIHNALEWVMNQRVKDPSARITDLLASAAERFCGGPKEPQTKAEMVCWLKHAEPAVRRYEPVECEVWYEKPLPGCKWPFVGKVDLKALEENRPTIVDWKSVKNQLKIPTEWQFFHLIQPSAYAWLTDCRRVAFEWFTPYHASVRTLAEYTDEDLARTEAWLARTCQAVEHRWEHGGWALADPGCGLCCEKWCPHWSECLGKSIRTETLQEPT